MPPILNWWWWAPPAEPVTPPPTGAADVTDRTGLGVLLDHDGPELGVA